MRTALRVFLAALALAPFLGLPGGAAEPAASCPGSTATSVVQAGMPDLSQIFGIAPKPQQKALVSCDQCPPPNSPNLQCFRQCRTYGLCPDQCYADADTCQLASCICLLC